MPSVASLHVCVAGREVAWCEGDVGAGLGDARTRLNVFGCWCGHMVGRAGLLKAVADSPCSIVAYRRSLLTVPASLLIPALSAISTGLTKLLLPTSRAREESACPSSGVALLWSDRFPLLSCYGVEV